VLFLSYYAVAAESPSPRQTLRVEKTVTKRFHPQPTVSVIIPCYNVEGYLQRALDSVYAQTFTDIEVIAVDDGSSDGTFRILEANSGRCKVISQAHAGAAAARNRAIEMSDSPYIAFLDADDEWLPHKLERQIEFLAEHPELGLVCSLCSMGERYSGARTIITGQDPAESDRSFRSLVQDCFVFTPTVVVRRLCLEQIGYFNESLSVSEDYNLWLRIAAGWPIARLPEILAITHERPGSLSASVSPELRLRNGISALEDVEANCSDLLPGEVRALRRALSERNYFYGSYLLSSGEKSASRRRLVTAYRQRLSNWRSLAKLGLSFLPARLSRSLLEFRSSADEHLARNHTQFVPRDVSPL
jgi:glycosyltransferase involved in cell wall biosynthesis